MVRVNRNGGKKVPANNIGCSSHNGKSQIIAIGIEKTAKSMTVLRLPSANPAS